jgi:hypothetical protein
MTPVQSRTGYETYVKHGWPLVEASRPDIGEMKWQKKWK